MSAEPLTPEAPSRLTAVENRLEVTVDDVDTLVCVSPTS